MPAHREIVCRSKKQEHYIYNAEGSKISKDRSLYIYKGSYEQCHHESN